MIILSSSKKIFLELLDIPWRWDGQLLSEVQYVLKVYLAEFGRLWAPFLLKMYCTYNVFRLCIACRDYSKNPVTNSKALRRWLANSLKRRQSYFFPDQHARGLLRRVWFLTSPFAIGDTSISAEANASVEGWNAQAPPRARDCLAVCSDPTARAGEQPKFKLPSLQARLVLTESICHQLKAYGWAVPRHSKGTAVCGKQTVSERCFHFRNSFFQFNFSLFLTKVNSAEPRCSSARMRPQRHRSTRCEWFEFPLPAKLLLLPVQPGPHVAGERSNLRAEICKPSSRSQALLWAVQLISGGLFVWKSISLSRIGLCNLPSSTPNATKSKRNREL